jgi:hypothetical protein
MSDAGGFGAPPPPPPPPPGGGGGIPGGGMPGGPGGGMPGGPGGGMPGGPGGGDVLQPRGLGDILSAAFEIYKENAAKLITIVAIVIVPLQLVSHLLTGAVLATKKSPVTIGGSTVMVPQPRAGSVTFFASLIAFAIVLIAAMVLQAAITRAAAQTTIHEPVDVGDSYRFGFKRFGAVLGLSLLVGFLVVLGLSLLIVPGVILLTLWAVCVPALVVERLGVTASMGRSWALAKLHFWHVLGTIFVAGLIAGFVAALIGALGGSNWFLGWIFGSIGAIITAPFSALVTVLLYLDLRTRVEMLTSQNLRSQLALT